jgi:spermidine synthase
LTDPCVKGVATLFTEDFFELAKRRLRPGGIVTQFVQLYQSSPEAVMSEIATFVKVFPNAAIWGNPQGGEGYDLVLVGQVDPIRIDIDALQRRLDQPSYRGVRESLQTVGIGSAVDLLARYVASGADLSAWLRGASINRDRDLRLQYLAGLGLDLDENRGIYIDLVRHGTFPSATFTGSPERLQQLRNAFESGRR